LGVARFRKRLLSVSETPPTPAKKPSFEGVFSGACNGVQRQATPVAETRKAAIHQEVTLVAWRFCAT